ncbi:Gfo/Idh/MocA family oxidoreductase [uncultured Polaribacter sp.]|uniref:Gfo/Idh/MocA family protein n=1 Tax=uncultured Polaribacter sp. TaxID=174711 RepID=UPI00262269AD|nr:Gfo/Idh/MocA family oxidoreductase [uncultured Polaribacter sp.]
METKDKSASNRKDKNSNILSRRKFIRNTSLVFAGITILPRHVLGKGFIAPSDKINLGVIGLGKQGNILSNKFLSNTGVQIIAGADVWNSKRTFFKNNLENLYAKHRNLSSFKGVDTYLDYNNLLNQKDIDAIIVATPDHWHAIQSIDAMNAGKHVYCEKPLTNTIAEGRAIADTVLKTNTIFQTGSMQRSWAKFITAKEIVSSGKLGEIKKVLVNVGDPARTYDLPTEPIPNGLDWNKWCGPAPLIGYNDKIAPKLVQKYPDWRDYKETGGGLLADWGAHMFDIAQWCLNMDHTGPVKFIPPKNTTAKRGLKMFYENGIEMVHEDFGRKWGVRFIGTKGTMDVSRGYLETTPASILKDAINVDLEFIMKNQGNHYQNWIDGIKTNKQPICHAEIGHRTATVCNAANIAYELGETLIWNPEKEKFKGNKQANKMRKRKNRTY